MTSNITQMTRRIAAVSLLVSLIAVLWFGAIQPIGEYLSTAADERGISLRAIKRNRALLRESSAIRAAQDTVEHSPRWRNFYDGPRTDAATVQMESDLRAILRDSNNPTSMSAEPPKVHGTVTRIGVRLTLSMRIDQLAEALDRIQKHPQQLRVEDLIIQAPEYQGGQVNPTLAIQALISAPMTTHGSH